MANNPVQIVLNTQNYIKLSELSGFGGHKDFYAGLDEGFLKHKEKLLDDMSQIKQAFSNDKNTVNYAHVVLSSVAWAKSHRPVKKIFPEKKVEEVGGGAIGEMFVELTADNLNDVVSSIEKAEENTTWAVDDKGNKFAKPSRERSEVGGISAIRLHSAEDRRSFSAEQAVEWLANPKTGGVYLVQLFITREGIAKREQNYKADLLASELDKLLKRIRQLGIDLSVEELESNWKSLPYLLIKVYSEYSESSRRVDVATHQRLLKHLENEPLVRRIILPPVLDKSNTAPSGTGEFIEAAPPEHDVDYPLVGVVDTGINDKNILKPWIAGSSDFLDMDSQDLSHGTFIGGLAALGAKLNSSSHFNELPCKVYDLGLHPTNSNYQDYYPRGFVDFMEQLDVEILAAKEKGVRVFNMSLSLEKRVEDDSYSEFAAMIDELSDKHNILFVLPAGNLDLAIKRNPWPKSPSDVVQMLADYRHQGMDRIFQPADSIRSVVVGAVNPPDESDDLVPTQYTRRGPSTALGVKPDLAHIGGRFERESGLFSVDVDGKLTQSCGTSYASPLVAKTLANLNHLIEGDVTRETLIGLLVHNSELPKSLVDKKLNHIAKDFVGHGVPQNSTESLKTDDFAITLVFTGAMKGRHELVFPFSWPVSLVGDEGKCRGKVSMTLAYTPFTDSNYDAEYVRVNMDAYLRQEKVDTETGEIKYKGFFQADSDSTYEKEKIEHGQKWWPVKHRTRTSKSGVGNSSQWRLVVDAITRAGDVIPEAGIPFSVILTIQDVSEIAPIFNEVRRGLQASGATIADIQTSQTIRARM